MILIDSNIPMYLVGADHPLKHKARILCEELIASSERLITDTEVIQEILHRYTSIRRRDAIQPCIDALYGLIDDVLPITEADVLRAKDLTLSYQKLSARDALHAAIMQQNKIHQILTFDRGFDLVPFLQRIS